VVFASTRVWVSGISSHISPGFSGITTLRPTRPNGPRSKRTIKNLPIAHLTVRLDQITLHTFLGLETRAKTL
jgi:hypothetical protein